MKLGLITDIHEHVGHLRTALDCLQQERVDQVVVIGDLVQMGEEIEETCRLLTTAKAVGVWGNHDYGLCYKPTHETRCRYGESVLTYMTSLLPRLQIDDCHFMHIEPWLNPTELADLWYFDGIPESVEALSRIFALPHRLMFAGHYHCWLLATPQGVEPWRGEQPIRLIRSNRYFAVIGALCEGRFAIYDTDSCELVPFNVGSRGPTTE